MIALVSIYTLALSSDNFKKFLMTRLVQFLGKISYVLYLSHTLVLFGPERDFNMWLENSESLPRAWCAVATYIVFTPL